MAKNFVQDGKVLTLTVAAAHLSGAPVLVGAIFGVAAGDAAAGGTADLITKGVFTLDKLSADVVAVGDLLYWDDTAKLVTKTSAGNTKVGVAVTAAGATVLTVQVRLNGSF